MRILAWQSSTGCRYFVVGCARPAYAAAAPEFVFYIQFPSFSRASLSQHPSFDCQAALIGRGWSTEDVRQLARSCVPTKNGGSTLPDFGLAKSGALIFFVRAVRTFCLFRKVWEEGFVQRKPRSYFERGTRRLR